MILLDTVTLIWFSLGDARLGPSSRSLLEEGDAFAVSVITAWEVAMLVRKRRLDLGQKPLAWIRTVLADSRMKLAPITPDVAIEAGLLPNIIHGDPADRLLIATAKDLECPILTPARQILAYSEQGLLEALDARR